MTTAGASARHRSCVDSTATAACAVTRPNSTSISRRHRISSARPPPPPSPTATATTPIQMLDRNWSAVYTTPQTYKNKLAFLNATGSYDVNDALTLKGNMYFRGFWQQHVDGNSSEIQSCDPSALPGFLCFGDA